MDLAHAPITSTSKSEIAVLLLFIGSIMCQYVMQGTVESKVLISFSFILNDSLYLIIFVSLSYFLLAFHGSPLYPFLSLTLCFKFAMA